MSKKSPVASGRRVDGRDYGRPCLAVLAPCLLLLVAVLAVPGLTQAQRVTISPQAPPTGVLVAWDYGSSGQNAFEVYRCVATPLGTGTCTPTTLLPFTLNAAARSATDSTIAINTRYCYAVQATSTTLPASGLTSAVCTDILPPPVNAQFAWDYAGSGHSGFELLRCTGGSCTPATPLALSLGPTARVATDTTAMGGTAYCYAVRAVKSGESPSVNSNATCVTPAIPGLATKLVYAPPPATSTATLPMTPFTVNVYDGYDQLVPSATVSITVSLLGTTEAAIPSALLTLVSVDSEELVEVHAPGIQAIDSDPVNTFWHTEYGSGTPAMPPHCLIVDLGQQYQVTGFRQNPIQQFAPTTNNGTIAQYQFYVSTTPLTCPVTGGVLAAAGTFPNSTAEQTVHFMSRTGRYVKLVALSEIHGGPWTGVANLSVLQTPQGGGALTGTVTVEASGGMATFTPTVTQAGTYVMRAASGILTPADAPFTVLGPPQANTSTLVRRVPR